jgi:hypothetical protein
MKTFMAHTVDVTGVTGRYRVTAADHDRARELVRQQMLAERQRPQTILICIPGGKP